MIRSMIAAADISKMSTGERLQAMELLWRSLSASAEEIASPDWHGEVLSRRLSKVEEGKGSFLTVSELKDRLRRKSA